jgi:uncharacterized protein YbjT (DUF2867 family)
MKFLVTGSAGLVGRQVVKDLLQSYTQVYSCTIIPSQKTE